MIRYLYFIGNGFDLHHGIRSKYTDYAYWLIDNNLDLFYKIESAFGWPNDDWWGDFENKIGEISIEEYTNDMCRNYAPDYGAEDFHERDRFAAEFEIERQLTELFESIRNSFHIWVSKLESANSEKRISMKTEDSYFINFNYTPTLESLYNVNKSNILYVHGKANRDKTLILGHGKTLEQINNELNKTASIKEQCDERDDSGYFYDRAIETTIDVIAKQRKNVEGIIAHNENLFNKFINVTDFFIYGLSFSSIDLPYIRKMFDVFDNDDVIIHISYYKDEDLQKAKTFITNERIKDTCVEFIKLDSIVEKAHTMTQVPKSQDS
jgi:hypothetical protein